MADGEGPKFGIGTLVSHPIFGHAKIVGYQDTDYCVMVKGGEVKRVAFTFDAMKAEDLHGDPELDRIKQAMREVLNDYGWIDGDLELSQRWQGGTVKIIPGKDDAQAKEIPIEHLFKKIISVREKLRVLEQKINNHPKLDDTEKGELQGYITRSYGSLTTFNSLFANKKSHFKGQGK